MFKKITRKRYEEYLYILHKKIQLHGLSWENDSAADLWAPELIQWILRGMWLLLLFFRLMCPCFTVIIRSWMHIDGSGIENTFFFFTICFSSTHILLFQTWKPACDSAMNRVCNFFPPQFYLKILHVIPTLSATHLSNLEIYMCYLSLHSVN